MASKETFNNSLSNAQPPSSFTPIEQAIWWAAKNDWEQSHEIAQAISTPMGSWLHAYLHREEGDKTNASYWYGRAGKSFPDQSLESELQQLINEAFDEEVST